MNDDILNDVSLDSEDENEMLDDMANDMLMDLNKNEKEIKNTISKPSLPVPSTSTATYSQPPDFSQMMSQMMPLMNQFMNVNKNNTIAADIDYSSWQEIIKDNLNDPMLSKEWIETILKDQITQRNIKDKKINFSRAYDSKKRTVLEEALPTSDNNEKMKTNKQLEVQNLLAIFLQQSIRKAENSINKSNRAKFLLLNGENLGTEFRENGLEKLYIHQLQHELKKKVQHNKDFKLEPNRFKHINTLLF